MKWGIGASGNGTHHGGTESTEEGGFVRGWANLHETGLQQLALAHGSNQPADAGVEQAAQGVLDARRAFPDQTLADLYDPLAMPKPLRDAHRALDKAVDRCYRAQPFDSDRHRVEYLFKQYERLTARDQQPLLGSA